MTSKLQRFEQAMRREVTQIGRNVYEHDVNWDPSPVK